MGGAAHEVAATLAALEAKLRELERELLGAAAAEPVIIAQPQTPAVAPETPPAPQPAPPAAAPEPAAPQEPLADLVAFRDLLERSAETLIAEYEQLLVRLRAGTSAPAATPEQTFEGRVSVEVGDFSDTAALLAFERALISVPGVREGRVASYDGRTATLHAVLDLPVALGSQLCRVSPMPCSVVAAGPDSLVLELSSAA